MKNLYALPIKSRDEIITLQAALHIMEDSLWPKRVSIPNWDAIMNDIGSLSIKLAELNSLIEEEAYNDET